MSDGMLLFPIGYAPTSDGAVVPGGKLHFTRTGTSTAQNTYSDSTLLSANANPVVLNSEGYLDTQVYGDPTTGFKYRVRLTDASDVQIWSRDDVSVNVDASTLDGIDSTDFARLSQTNTFTGNTIVLGGSSPGIQFRETDGPTNENNWLFEAASGTLTFYALNDANATFDPYLSVTRTGGNVDSLALTADAVTINGGTAWHSGNQIVTATAANLASAAATINTTGKFEGKLVLDTTNHKLYSARGATATSQWDLADGSASVTPA